MQFFKKLVVVVVTCGSLLSVKAALAVTYVCAETTRGGFCMEMKEEDAPGTVANFLNYVRDGDYDQTFIHRTAPGYVVEGGGFKLDPFAEEVPKDPPIANEFKLSNLRGTVAMLKTTDQPDSATSEWFVNLSDNTSLDTANGGSTVFATIVSGLSVLEDISNSLRVDLSATLGAEFSEVPVVEKDDDGVDQADLIQVKRVFISDVILYLEPDTYQCVADWVASLQPTQACMDTSMGSFCIDLRPDAAPQTVANFLHYVADGDYNDSFFHRSVKDFVVQAGGFKLHPIFSPVPSDPVVPNEFNISNTRGTVAMAKGSEVDSATSQWFVNTKDNSSNLDTNTGGFTVFGQINDEGMGVIDAIAALPIWDLSSDQYSALGETPLLRDNVAGDLNTGDFVKISNAYIPGAGPNPCFEVKPAALTEYANGKFEVPVRIGPNLFMVLFEDELNNDGDVFRVNRTKFRSMVDRGQQAAVYTSDDGMLTIPSVLVSGTVLTNVRLRLTDPSILQFTYESRSP